LPSKILLPLAASGFQCRNKAGVKRRRCDDNWQLQLIAT
jgi:hypothetical protein